MQITFFACFLIIWKTIHYLTETHICSHPTHQEWWGTSAEQPVTEFYKRCSKCKKCYIRLQQESKRQRLSLEGHSPMAAPVMLQPPYGGILVSSLLILLVTNDSKKKKKLIFYRYVPTNRTREHVTNVGSSLEERQ